MMYEVLLMDDELNETVVLVDVPRMQDPWNDEWVDETLVPAVRRTGHDPDLIEDFWEAGQDEEG